MNRTQRVCYITDSLQWVQAQRARDLQIHLPDHELIVMEAKNVDAMGLIARSYDAVWLASWRILLARPELEQWLHWDQVLAGVTSHYNLGGGLNPATCFRKGADPQEEFQKAISLLKWFRLVTCNSKILHAILAPHLLPNLVLAQNGVDADYFQPPVVNRRVFKPPPRIGWVGKDKGAKNVTAFLTALQRLDGSAARFNAIIPKKHGGPVKARSGMLNFYWETDFLACTSFHEGTPNPALEAAACGLPIIGTAVGNLPELIREGETGWFIEPTAESLVSTIERLQHLQGWEYDRMSHAIRAEIEASWTWAKRAEPYRKALEAVCG